MSAEHFVMRWHGHRDVLVPNLENLLKIQKLVDCTLAAEGQYLQAHKLILSACSPYFELLFSQDWNKHPIVILKDVKYQQLVALIDFVYHGEVQVHQCELEAFLDVANSLQIKGLEFDSVRNDSGRKRGEDAPLLVESIANGNKSQVFDKDHEKTCNVDANIGNDTTEVSDDINIIDISSSQVSCEAFGINSTNVSDHSKSPEFIAQNHTTPLTVTTACTSVLSPLQCQDNLKIDIENHQLSSPSLSSLSDVTRDIKEELMSEIQEMPNLDFTTVTVDEAFVEDNGEMDDVKVIIEYDLDPLGYNNESSGTAVVNRNGVHGQSPLGTGGAATCRNSEKSSCSVDCPCRAATTYTMQDMERPSRVAVRHSNRCKSAQLSNPVATQPRHSVTVQSRPSRVQHNSRPATAQSSKLASGQHSRSERTPQSKSVTSPQKKPPTSPRRKPLTSPRKKSVTSPRSKSMTAPQRKHVISQRRKPMTSPRRRSMNAQQSRPITGAKLSTGLSQRDVPKYAERCQKCGKFIKLSKLQRQLRMRTGQQIFYCMNCEKPLKSEEIPLKTEEIPLKTGERIPLKTRERIPLKKGEVIHKCELCGKTFLKRPYLNAHYRVHTGERPFKCELCDKAYGHATTLRIHRRLHTGERPYKCQYCKTAFTSNSYLRVHLRIHTGERPYKCEKCEAAFRSRGNLGQHMLIHTRIKNDL